MSTEPPKVWMELNNNGVQTLFSYDSQTRMTASWEIPNHCDSGSLQTSGFDSDDEYLSDGPMEALNYLRGSVDAGEYRLDNAVVANLLNSLWREFDTLCEEGERLNSLPADSEEQSAAVNELVDKFEQKARALLQNVMAVLTLLPKVAMEEDVEQCGFKDISPQQLQQYEKDGKVSSSFVEQCLICLDEYKAEDEVAAMTCQHAFHRVCLDKWLETGQSNCPACRTALYTGTDAPWQEDVYDPDFIPED